MFVGDNLNDYYEQYKAFTAKDKQIAWRYEIGIDDFDLTLHAYTVSLPLFEISQNTSEIATIEKNKAERLTSRVLSLSIFDDDDGRNQKYFEAWKQDIIPHTDGIPNGLYKTTGEYTRRLKFQMLTFQGKKKMDPVFITCWPTKVGDLEYSRAESKLLEFPVSLIESRTV
jgi:hypothetical protein